MKSMNLTSSSRGPASVLRDRVSPDTAAGRAAPSPARCLLRAPSHVPAVPHDSRHSTAVRQRNRQRRHRHDTRHSTATFLYLDRARTNFRSIPSPVQYPLRFRSTWIMVLWLLCGKAVHSKSMHHAIANCQLPTAKSRYRFSVLLNLRLQLM